MVVDSSWQEIIARAYGALDLDYRNFLSNGEYFPRNFLQPFLTLPRGQTRYILFGQDPYPREESASGYAFIDGAVREIFGPTGLTKEVNRATSLRNFIKMALIARGCSDVSQKGIAAIKKTNLITSITQLRENFEKNGVLLLNASLVFTDKKSTPFHTKAWLPFMVELLNSLDSKKVKLILFGSFASSLHKQIPQLDRFEYMVFEHPYNLSFITNPKVHELFAPMDLLAI